MATYYTTNRPSKEYIEKMILKANEVQKKQTELLLDNGDNIVYAVNKRQFNKGFKKN